MHVGIIKYVKLFTESYNFRDLYLIFVQSSFLKAYLSQLCCTICNIIVPSINMVFISICSKAI